MLEDKKEDIENDIEIRSEEVQDILGRPPKWIIRWGITLIFTIILGLFIGSYFFKYPEIVTAPIVVTTENLPVDIVARATGRIDTLFIREKQQVKEKDLLGVIENPASVSDVLYLEKILDTVQLIIMHSDTINNLRLSPNLHLGDLQNTYTAFLKAYEDYRYFLQTNYHRNKIKVIEKQMDFQKRMLLQSKSQLSLTQEQLEVARKLFSMDSALFAKSTISVAEYEQSRSTMLQNFQSYENAKTNVENQNINILQLEQSIFDLEQQRTEQMLQLRLSLIGTSDQLHAQLKTWEQNYLFRSPVGGTVTMTQYWQKNQNVTAGETIMTIVPTKSAHIIGKIYLPPQGAGKVKVGQTVNVKFDNFPYMEYGVIKVTVKNIALVPIMQDNQRNYLLEVDFPQSLITNYGKELDFSQEMQGTAEIITEDLRLIDRFLNPIKALIIK